MIDSSVSVDFENKQTVAVLPFVADPERKLESNEHNSNRIYSQQVRKLSKLPLVRQAVLESEKKLQEAGHVDWIHNLTAGEIELLKGQASRYFMPWRFVHNENSTTTPTRLVFDASSVSMSG